jgi:hypothetical protein
MRVGQQSENVGDAYSTTGFYLRQKSLIRIALTTLFLMLCSTPAFAATHLWLTADRIQFYYDRFLVEADGHVRIQSSDGTTVTGDTFSMDLKLNRFLVASNVHLTSPGGDLSGAAISDFLDFRRVYFVPVLGDPDRWTYVDGDYTKPLKGREMPGDVFEFPQNLAHPSLDAESAMISERKFVRFNNVKTYLFGVGSPLPSFYVNFSTNKDLAQNSLSAASFDATWNSTGSDNAITSWHLRSDPVNHQYVSFEQHFAGENEYAVFSVNPLTKPQKFWNLILDDRIGQRFELHTFSQLYTDQSWLTQPSAAALTNYVTATQAFQHSYLQALATFTNYNLIGPASPAIPNHPAALQLYASTFNNRIGHSPFFEQLRYGFGYNHDAYGLQNYGGVNYTTIWNHSLGFDFYLSSLKLGDHENAYKTYYVNASYSRNRQWNSLPHYIDSASTTASLSRQFNRAFGAYASYNIANTGDYYRHGGYVPYTPIVDGQKVYSFNAFRGFSTLRTASLQLTYSSNPNFLATVLARQHQDFPLPYPGLFPPPPLNVIGQYTTTNYLGQPPYDITGEVRARLMPHLLVDVQRTYFFNFGQLRWSPQFVVQVTP